jgi:RHS repeat-associated protein
VEIGAQVLAVHADGLGSVTGLSDGSQTLVETRAYTAFGRMQRGGNFPALAYAYTGRESEPELGLYYYRARYYDPEAGRFLSRDPIGFSSGDTNLYAYVSGDPVNLVDPSGLQAKIDPPGVGGSSSASPSSCGCPPKSTVELTLQLLVGVSFIETGAAVAGAGALIIATGGPVGVVAGIPLVAAGVTIVVLGIEVLPDPFPDFGT